MLYTICTRLAGQSPTPMDKDQGPRRGSSQLGKRLNRRYHSVSAQGFPRSCSRLACSETAGFGISKREHRSNAYRIEHQGRHLSSCYALITVDAPGCVNWPPSLFRMLLAAVHGRKRRRCQQDRPRGHVCPICLRKLSHAIPNLS